MTQAVTRALSGKHRLFFSAVFIMIGVSFLSVSVNMIYDPMKFSVGGFSGLAIILKEAFSRIGVHVPIWVINVALNIPVFLTAWAVLGKKFVARTVFGILAFSAALAVIPSFDLCQGDRVLAAVFGGMCDGIGISFVFLTHSTTGGTDMVSAILHRFLKQYTLPQILFAVDGCIVVAGAIMFGLQSGMYACIAIYISAKISDFILEGMHSAKMAYVISESYRKISDRVMEEIGRGVTGMQVTGMYTNEDKKMLLCVLGKKELVTLKEIALEEDPRAFVIVGDVREALGEGFLEYGQNTD